MKQRISIEDLNTLTDEQKERLRSWWVPQKGDIVLRDYDKAEYVVIRTYDGPAKEDNTRWFVGLDNHAGISNKDCLPLLTIGQMIEFANPIRMEYKAWEYDDFKRDEWVVELAGGWIYHNINLFTAIFDAVKQLI